MSNNDEFLLVLQAIQNTTGISGKGGLRGSFGVPPFYMFFFKKALVSAAFPVELVPVGHSNLLL